MRVAISGVSGRMGSLIAKTISESTDIELVAAFDPVGVGEEIYGVKISDPADMDRILSEKNPDILIDFTNPDACVENVKIAVKNGVNLIIGTTGLSEEQKMEIEREVKEKVVAVISPNFSIGVNIFWKLVRNAGEMLKDFDVEIVEAHHRQKKDAPSGTAVLTGDILKSVGKGVTFHSIRAGDIVGDHTVLFAGIGERIEITHRAHSRMAFVSGVIRAIRWIKGVKKGIYSMDDVIGAF
ncbi:MAG: 4-hydroxy-tetrahydrodipicolinate reductase [Candidatus Syntropharchaeia archaeon]